MADPDPTQVREALQHIQSVDQITDDYKPYFQHGQGQTAASSTEATSQMTPTMPPEGA
jgi:hypothetical protein